MPLPTYSRHAVARRFEGEKGVIGAAKKACMYPKGHGTFNPGSGTCITVPWVLKPLCFEGFRGHHGHMTIRVGCKISVSPNLGVPRQPTGFGMFLGCWISLFRGFRVLGFQGLGF